MSLDAPAPGARWFTTGVVTDSLNLLIAGLRRWLDHFAAFVAWAWYRSLGLFDMAYQVVARQKSDATADFVEAVFDTIMRDVGLLERTSTIPRQVVVPLAAPTLPPPLLPVVWPLSLPLK